MEKRPTDHKRQQDSRSDTKALQKEPRGKKRHVVDDEEDLREAEWMEEGFACHS